MTFPNNAGFHDSSLTALSTSGTSTKMQLEDVIIDSRKEAVELVLEGVRDITEDDRPSERLIMVMPDAEVLTLKEKDGWVDLIVEWNDFKLRQSLTRAYRFRISSAQFRIVP